MGLDDDGALLRRLQTLVTGDFGESSLISAQTSIFTSRTDVSIAHTARDLAIRS